MDMQTQGKVEEVKGMMKKILPRIIGLVSIGAGER